MLPDTPSPRAALALSDLQPQTGTSFSVGTGSGNWSTHGVGGVGNNSYEKNNNGLFGANRQQDRSYDSFFGGNSNSQGCSCSSGGGGLFGKN